MKTELRDICDKIHSHFSEINKDKVDITSFTCYFKSDYENKLTLMFFSKFTIDSVKTSFLDEFKVPDNLIPFMSFSKKKAKLQFSNFECSICKKKCIIKENVHQIKYKDIIEFHKKDIYNKKFTNNQTITSKDVTNGIILERNDFVKSMYDTIPNVIKKNHPSMTYEEYTKNIKDDTFRDREVLACSDCC